jgi:hypothetical protein
MPDQDFMPGDTFQITKPTSCCNNTGGIGTIHVALETIMYDAVCKMCGAKSGPTKCIKFVLPNKTHRNVIVAMDRCLKFTNETENNL